jgi:hypothetical protein
VFLLFESFKCWTWIFPHKTTILLEREHISPSSSLISSTQTISKLRASSSKFTTRGQSATVKLNPYKYPLYPISSSIWHPCVGAIYKEEFHSRGKS